MTMRDALEMLSSQETWEDGVCLAPLLDDGANVMAPSEHLQEVLDAVGVDGDDDWLKQPVWVAEDGIYRVGEDGYVKATPILRIVG